jgi:hypothetical protein
MRVAAGLETRKIYSVSPELRALQAAAGIWPFKQVEQTTAVDS